MPFLNDLLSRAASLLPHLKQDSFKSAWSQALCSFCESVMESASENETEVATEPQENGFDDKNGKHNFADQFESTYDIVLSWVGAKDYKVI